MPGGAAVLPNPVGGGGPTVSRWGCRSYTIPARAPVLLDCLGRLIDTSVP